MGSHAPSETRVSPQVPVYQQITLHHLAGDISQGIAIPIQLLKLHGENAEEAVSGKVIGIVNLADAGSETLGSFGVVTGKLYQVNDTQQCFKPDGESARYLRVHNEAIDTFIRIALEKGQNFRLPAAEVTEFSWAFFELLDPSFSDIFDPLDGLFGDQGVDINTIAQTLGVNGDSGIPLAQPNSFTTAGHSHYTTPAVHSDSTALAGYALPTSSFQVDDNNVLASSQASKSAFDRARDRSLTAVPTPHALQSTLSSTTSVDIMQQCEHPLCRVVHDIHHFWVHGDPYLDDIPLIPNAAVRGPKHKSRTNAEKADDKDKRDKKEKTKKGRLENVLFSIMPGSYDLSLPEIMEFEQDDAQTYIDTFVPAAGRALYVDNVGNPASPLSSGAIEVADDWKSIEDNRVYIIQKIIDILHKDPRDQPFDHKDRACVDPYMMMVHRTWQNNGKETLEAALHKKPAAYRYGRVANFLNKLIEAHRLDKIRVPEIDQAQDVHPIRASKRLVQVLQVLQACTLARADLMNGNIEELLAAPYLYLGRKDDNCRTNGLKKVRKHVQNNAYVFELAQDESPVSFSGRGSEGRTLPHYHTYPHNVYAQYFGLACHTEAAKKRIYAPLPAQEDAGQDDLFGGYLLPNTTGRQQSSFFDPAGWNTDGSWPNALHQDVSNESADVMLTQGNGNKRQRDAEDSEPQPKTKKLKLIAPPPRDPYVQLSSDEGSHVISVSAKGNKKRKQSKEGAEPQSKRPKITLKFSGPDSGRQASTRSSRGSKSAVSQAQSTATSAQQPSQVANGYEQQAQTPPGYVRATGTSYGDPNQPQMPYYLGSSAVQPGYQSQFQYMDPSTFR